MVSWVFRCARAIPNPKAMAHEPERSKNPLNSSAGSVSRTLSLAIRPHQNPNRLSRSFHIPSLLITPRTRQSVLTTRDKKHFTWLGDAAETPDELMKMEESG